MSSSRFNQFFHFSTFPVLNDSLPARVEGKKSSLAFCFTTPFYPLGQLNQSLNDVCAGVHFQQNIGHQMTNALSNDR